jgi:hypothetical protein
MLRWIRFSHTWKSHRRDRTGWLGREDSNLGIAGVAHMLTATTTTADSEAHYYGESAVFWNDVDSGAELIDVDMAGCRAVGCKPNDEAA